MNNKCQKGTKYFITLILGATAGFFIGWTLSKEHEKSDLSKRGFAKDTMKRGAKKARQQWKKRDEKLEAILEYFEDHTGVSRDEVKEFLSVSGSTASSYLDELEEKEVIRRIEEDGEVVCYVKN